MPVPSAHDIRLKMAMGYSPTSEEMAILQQGTNAPPTTPSPDPTTQGSTPGLTGQTGTGPAKDTSVRGDPTIPTFSGETSEPPLSYSYSGESSNISDYAGGYMSFLADNPQYVVDLLSPYINSATGTISISDINNALHTVQDWTGSGRQGAGRFSLQDMLYDSSGNPLMYQSTPTSSEEGGFSGSTYTFSPSASLQDLFSGDTMPWATTSMQEYLTPGQYRTWQDLDPAQQQALANQGIFNMDDSRAQFILTDQNDPQWNQYFSGIDTTGGNIRVDQLEQALRGGLSRQFDALGNTSQTPTEGWLFENPQVMLQMLGYAIPGLGQVLGASNMQALTQAGNVLNLGSNVLNLGNALANENWTQAALGGFGLYNNAANLANSANFGNTNPTAMGSPYYQQYTPGSVVGGLTGNTMPEWVNSAVGNAGVAALTGGDPLYYAGQSLVGSAGDALLEQLGIQPGDMLYSLGQAGLNYLYGNAYNNWQNSGGGGSGGGGTGGGTTPPGTGGGGGGGTTPTPLPGWEPMNPPSFNYPQPPSYNPSPYGQIPGGGAGSGYGSTASYGTGETYGGDSAQDPGNPYNWSKPETVYG